MEEQSPLNDPKSSVLVVDPEKDSYRNGMTVEDAYRYLSGAPRTPIEILR